jgi:hypothetical protein
VAGAVPFTDNYQDHSTESGYQFEFFCERCGNGYKSEFKASMLGMGGKAARALGGVFGGKLNQIGWSAGYLQDQSNSPAKDKALREAVEEVGPLFNQCHRCGQWVCKEICWNPEFNMCVTCAPKIEGEIAAAQSDARLQQVRDKTQQVDWTGDLNLERKQMAMCPQCGAEAPPSGKFCADCGAAITAPVTCSKCGTEAPRGTKFCPECGRKL